MDEIHEIPDAPAIPDSDARLWATLCHLAGLLMFVGIPFANLIGPLVIWLVKRDSSPYVDREGKEAVNFQISMTIYGVVSILLMFVLIGLGLFLLLAIANLVLCIIAGIKANEGAGYRYPLNLRLMK